MWLCTSIWQILQCRWYWKFVQQKLPGWAPIVTANGVVLYFLIATIVCVAIGVPVLIASINIEQFDIRYDRLSPFTGSRREQQQLLYDQQGGGVPVSGSIRITKTMHPPVRLFELLFFSLRSLWAEIASWIMLSTQRRPWYSEPGS